MGLPNDTDIPYRQLTIPCCTPCNSRWLLQLEDRVATAYREGPDAFEALGPMTLSLWLSKVYYGLLFKDISLALDRSNPRSGPLLEPDWLTSYFDLHQLLQMIRGAITVTPGQVPASIFVFRTHDSEITKHRFDFRDTTAVPFIALRLGPVAIVGCLPGGVYPIDGRRSRFSWSCRRSFGSTRLPSPTSSRRKAKSPIPSGTAWRLRITRFR
jgi:hypothetical protein